MWKNNFKKLAEVLDDDIGVFLVLDTEAICAEAGVHACVFGGGEVGAVVADHPALFEGTSADGGCQEKRFGVWLQLLAPSAADGGGEVLQDTKLLQNGFHGIVVFVADDAEVVALREYREGLGDLGVEPSLGRVAFCVASGHLVAGKRQIIVIQPRDGAFHQVPLAVPHVGDHLLECELLKST